MEPGDRDTRMTAMRETVEETGLMLDSSARIGRLSDVVTRQHARMRPMIVSPHVFHLAGDDEPQWRLNHEVAEVVWVPLAFFADDRNRQNMHWRTGRLNWQMPCYFYEERRIWGLTLLMLRELLGISHGVNWRSMRPVRGQMAPDYADD
jgi:8-oxo-dGTP pyrophosphatase MutT (NUDIX family)